MSILCQIQGTLAHLSAMEVPWAAIFWRHIPMSIMDLSFPKASWAAFASLHPHTAMKSQKQVFTLLGHIKIFHSVILLLCLGSGHLRLLSPWEKGGSCSATSTGLPQGTSQAAVCMFRFTELLLKACTRECNTRNHLPFIQLLKPLMSLKI